MTTSTATSLAELHREIISCMRCSRLVEFREGVARTKRRMYRDWDYWGRPIPGFGDAAARVLIVGLAPAAHGGNRTGRIFTGDSSGDWLWSALHKVGFSNLASARRRDDDLALKDVYVTAAARCAPPGNKPTADELANCRDYLMAELLLMTEVRVVVALGKIAFDSCLTALVGMGQALPSPRPKFEHGATHRFDENLTVICSYHPSRQNTQTGRLTREMFEALFEKVRGLLRD